VNDADLRCETQETSNATKFTLPGTGLNRAMQLELFLIKRSSQVVVCKAAKLVLIRLR
jgi:hypothetical protein